mgnify:CR=1 FL=1
MKYPGFGGGVLAFLCRGIRFPLWKYDIGRILKITRTYSQKKRLCVRPCMYRTYLSTLHCKKHSEKNESDHGGAARRASSGMAFVIETKSLPTHVRDGLIQGPVEGLYIIH